MSKALELLANIDKKVQQRITEYRGTTSERHRANVTDYQRQLEHKSKYHVERYPTVGRGDLTAHSERLTADRDATRPVPSLATVQIEPFKANERSNKDSRAPSTEPTDRKKLSLLNMGLILAAAIFAIVIIALGFMGKSKYSEIKTLNTMIVEKQTRVDH